MCLSQLKRGPHDWRRFSAVDVQNQTVEVHVSADKSLYQVKVELLLKQLRRAIKRTLPECGALCEQGPRGAFASVEAAPA
eukprot:7008080-Pyramimonas_sp.AAC.1